MRPAESPSRTSLSAPLCSPAGTHALAAAGRCVRSRLDGVGGGVGGDHGANNLTHRAAPTLAGGSRRDSCCSAGTLGVGPEAVRWSGPDGRGDASEGSLYVVWRLVRSLEAGPESGGWSGAWRLVRSLEASMESGG